jgi:hypothetical protein
MFLFLFFIAGLFSVILVYSVRKQYKTISNHRVPFGRFSLVASDLTCTSRVLALALISTAVQCPGIFCTGTYVTYVASAPLARGEALAGPSPTQGRSGRGHSRPKSMPLGSHKAAWASSSVSAYLNPAKLELEC